MTDSLLVGTAVAFLAYSSSTAIAVYASVRSEYVYEFYNGAFVTAKQQC